MHLTAGEGVQKQVPAFSRLQGFGEQVVARRQARPTQLGLQQWLYRLHFRPVETPMRRRVKTFDYRLGQLVGKRHTPAIPAWHRGFFRTAAAHVGGHVFHAHQFQQTPGEQKPIPGLSRAIKPSSTLPRFLPPPPLLQNFNWILASLTMVPTLMR